MAESRSNGRHVLRDSPTFISTWRCAWPQAFGARRGRLQVLLVGQAQECAAGRTVWVSVTQGTGVELFSYSDFLYQLNPDRTCGAKSTLVPLSLTRAAGPAAGSVFSRWAKVEKKSTPVPLVFRLLLSLGVVSFGPRPTETGYLYQYH
jgi:hypothetical protein